MNLDAWAIKWGVSRDAIDDFRRQVSREEPQVEAGAAMAGSEARVSSAVRLEASRKGLRVWRNNVGAGYVSDSPDGEGMFMRWGLANDSKQMNTVLKSADLIGIRPVVVTPQLVGHTLGVFVSRECKVPGWSYKGTPRETAQLAWINLILSLGGDAAFATGDNTL